MGPDLPDRTLVAAARVGDASALASLIGRHYGPLLGSCRRMLGDPELARDAAQEAAVRAMLGLPQLRDGDRFGSWLIGIGLNVCRTLLGGRRERPLPPAELARASADADARIGAGQDRADPAASVASAELTQRVRAAVAELPVGQRRAVFLAYLGGLTHAEIADELGTAPGAIKTRLHAARKRLRGSLSDTYEEFIQMPDQTTAETPIPMQVAELRRTDATDTTPRRHILYLRADDGRRLRIWIGDPEATSIATAMEDVQLPRPGVYQFAAALLRGAGAALREVHVTELSGYTFYARAILSDGTEIDARPSDALTLALVCGVPIFVAPAVLAQTEQHSDRDELRDQADQAPDAAHEIVEELQARHAATLAELRARYEAEE